MKMLIRRPMQTWSSQRLLGGPTRRGARFPIYGSIPAGVPEDPAHESGDFLSLDLDPLDLPKPSARIFALRVKGDSMQGVGILDGDWAIIEHAREPYPGCVVAAYIDGKCTLKMLVRQGPKAYLKAANPLYRDLVPVEELQIQGVVIALYRKLH